jgi:hypothetical protein
MKKSIPASARREDLALLPDSAHNLSVEEVKLLWSFLHGDIMIGETRKLLRQHWGLCARHAWGHAVVEIELWQAGAGRRAGHQPFDVGILYEDLLETMIRDLSASRARSRMWLLTGRGICPVCKDLHGYSIPGLPGGYASSNSIALTDETNQMTHMRAWVAETRALWRVCPACAASPVAGEGGPPLCRPHILERGSLDDQETRRLLTDLTETRQLLLALIDSMTQTGRPATPAADASWIHALGWFNGWALPLALANTDPGTEQRIPDDRR